MTLTELLARPFRAENLREQALTHKSYANENPDRALGDNERLEFLGDAVLALVIGDILYRRYPELSEGELSKARASLVNEATLASLARVCQLDQQIRLGKGELVSQGAHKPRIQASALEALIGAFYLDQGYEVASQLIEALFDETLKDVTAHIKFAADFKTRLQERAQELHKEPPSYELIKEEGPDHSKVFTVQVRIDGRVLATGQGRSKKQAEQDAARVALEEVK